MDQIFNTNYYVKIYIKLVYGEEKKDWKEQIRFVLCNYFSPHHKPTLCQS